MQLFAYFAAWLALLSLAAAGLVACLLAAMFASRRQSAKRVAGGILASLPGVLFFQIIAAPVVAAAVVVFLALRSVTGELSGAPQVAFSALALLLTFGVFAGASLLGLLVGWGVGYRLASGVPFVVALRSSRVLAGPLRLVSRLKAHSAA